MVNEREGAEGGDGASTKHMLGPVTRLPSVAGLWHVLCLSSHPSLLALQGLIWYVGGLGAALSLTFRRHGFTKALTTAYIGI